MAAYVIVDIEVTDPTTCEEYREKVAPLVAKYGGKYLVRGGASEPVEGDWVPNRLVVLEFESMDRLKEFYHGEEYRPVMAIRTKCTVSKVVIVDGA